MPSNAYSKFRKNMKQVERLLAAYDENKGSTPGKRGLDHFTRAALLFLCSSWEVYIEQVANEAGEVITTRISQPSQLPMHVKKKIASIIKMPGTNYPPFSLSMIGKHTT